MNVSINKETGFIIESQPNASEDVLIQNAVSSGFSAENVEVRDMAEDELHDLLESQRESRLTYADKRKAEYLKLNQFEMQFDDDRDGTTTWIDKINEIKGRHPK